MCIRDSVGPDSLTAADVGAAAADLTAYLRSFRADALIALSLIHISLSSRVGFRPGLAVLGGHNSSRGS